MHTEAAPKDKPKKHWIDYITVALELVGLIVLSIYAWYTIQIYRSGKQAADTAHDALTDARKNFIADQRPIIWLTNDIGEPKEFINPKNHELGQIVWTWHFTNYGKTPPKELQFRQFMKIADKSDVLSYGEKGDDIGAPIPPGKIDFDTVISEPMQRSEMDSLIKGGHIGVHIVLDYVDAYDTSYETEICLQRNNAGAVTYCPGTNHIK